MEEKFLLATTAATASLQLVHNVVVVIVQESLSIGMSIGGLVGEWTYWVSGDEWKSVKKRCIELDVDVDADDGRFVVYWNW